MGLGLVTSPGGISVGCDLYTTSSIWPGTLTRTLSEISQLLSPPSPWELGVFAEALRSGRGCPRLPFLPASGLCAGPTACQLVASQARLRLLYKAPFHLGASGKHNEAGITGAGASLGDMWQGARYC